MKLTNAQLKKAIFPGCCLLLALLALLFLLHWHSLSRSLLSQQAAERWQGENEQSFAQVSCFLPINGSISMEDIYTFRSKANQALLDAGLEDTEDGSLFQDAYATFSELSVQGAYGQVNVTAVGVGGDWFLFHPLALRSGSYIGKDDLMHDQVVLDEAAAFKLFGAIDVAGMMVQINGIPYTVAGVVAREDDRFSEQARTESALVFLHEDMLPGAAITCYEYVMADPLSKFAAKVATDAFPLQGGVSLENSARFRFPAINHLIWNFSERSAASDGVAFPWWENAARMLEMQLAIWMVLIVLLALMPTGYVAYLLFKLIKYGKKLLRAKITAWRERE